MVESANGKGEQLPSSSIHRSAGGHLPDREYAASAITTNRPRGIADLQEGCSELAHSPYQTRVELRASLTALLSTYAYLLRLLKGVEIARPFRRQTYQLV